MARLLSQVATIIRGHVGGLTYTANQFYPIIMRARTAPVNPRTNRQAGIRSSFARANGIWKTLTQGTRDLWQVYADQTPLNGPLGQYHITGRMFFIAGYGLASYLSDLNIGTIVLGSDPPLVPGLLGVGAWNVGLFAQAAATGIAIDYTNDLGIDTVAFAVRSGAYNTTRRLHHGPWQARTMLGDDAPGPSSIQLLFDGLVEDQVYFTRGRSVATEAPHIISAEFVLRHIAVTNV